MAFTYRLGRVRTSSAGNPITFTYEVLPGVSVLALLMKVAGATNRAGGSPTLGSTAFTVRAGVVKAAASPETSVEYWDVLNPVPGDYTITVPNTGALTIFITMVEARGGTGVLRQVSSSNGTSTNPTPGSVTMQDPGIVFAIVGSGAQTWNPSAQVGTIIANTDDGTHGGGEQYLLTEVPGGVTLSWTFGTSEDWGAIAVGYTELPVNQLENYKAIKGVGMSRGIA
jgi:hypothetical protein